LASLDVFERDDVLAGSRRTAERIGELLAREVEPLSHVAEVRRRGLMVGIELVADRDGRVAYEPGERIGQRVCEEVRRHGVVLRPLGNVIVLMPPLSLSLGEADLLVGAAARAIREVTGA
ncbi:MAG: aminotransferase class III-fold pyridoxal phosphate-dependent enzyme, partial [Alphaproteobacteria bacterium]